MFDHATATELDFNAASIFNYLAVGSEFVRCDFHDTVFGGGVLGDIPITTYRGCDFSGADLRSVDPQFARFEACVFDSANLADWTAMCAEFIDCRFVGHLLRAKFSARPLGFGKPRIEPFRSVNEFRGNDFSEAVLDDCSFVGGIDLDANRWPRSPTLTIVRDIREALAGARSRLGELRDDQASAAEVVIRILSGGGFEYQEDAIVDTSFLEPIAALLDRPVK